MKYFKVDNKIFFSDHTSFPTYEVGIRVDYDLVCHAYLRNEDDRASNTGRVVLYHDARSDLEPYIEWLCEGSPMRDLYEKAQVTDEKGYVFNGVFIKDRKHGYLRIHDVAWVRFPIEFPYKMEVWGKYIKHGMDPFVASVLCQSRNECMQEDEPHSFHFPLYPYESSPQRVFQNLVRGKLKVKRYAKVSSIHECEYGEECIYDCVERLLTKRSKRGTVDKKMDPWGLREGNNDMSVPPRKLKEFGERFLDIMMEGDGNE